MSATLHAMLGRGGSTLASGEAPADTIGGFGDDTWFYPGHGNDSTLGAERPSLPEWRARGW